MGAVHKLPIPVIFNGQKIEEATIKQIKTSVIADTNKIVQKGDLYRAIQTFVTGGIEKAGDITDRQTLLNLVGAMSYKSAFLLAVKIIMQDEKDDGVEGLYPCPMCGEKKVCEHNEDDKLDTRDFISDLRINYLEEGNPFVEYELETPVVIKDVDGREETVSKLEIVYPSINDCSMAFGKVGKKDEIRLQLAIYVEALNKVNDEVVDRKFKSTFGMVIFEQMSRRDMQKLSQLIDKFGLDTKAHKICNACGKEWDVNLNTSNFFGSALRSGETS